MSKTLRGYIRHLYPEYFYIVIFFLFDYVKKKENEEKKNL